MADLKEMLAVYLYNSEHQARHGADCNPDWSSYPSMLKGLYREKAEAILDFISRYKEE